MSSPANTEVSGLWLLPDYDDFVHAGRSVMIKFAATATASEAVEDLRELAAELAASGFAAGVSSPTLIGDEVEYQTKTARIGPRLNAEVAELLLRLAVNHVRRVGVPQREDWLVMTDPFEEE